MKQRKMSLLSEREEGGKGRKEGRDGGEAWGGGERDNKKKSLVLKKIRTKQAMAQI